MRELKLSGGMTLPRNYYIHIGQVILSTLQIRRFIQINHDRYYFV